MEHQDKGFYWNLILFVFIFLVINSTELFAKTPNFLSTKINHNIGQNIQSPNSFSTNFLSSETIPLSNSFSNVIQISSGNNYICAISDENKLYCWGKNDYGQLGDGTRIDKTTPVYVNNEGLLDNKGVIAVSSGYNHTCAINSEYRLFCWGNNYYGKLGKGTTDDYSITPALVNTNGYLDNNEVISVHASYDHTCAINNDNKIFCWGNNEYGQLGDGTTVSSFTPVYVNTTGLLNKKKVISFSTKGPHTCAINENYKLFCWGYNWNGQLGDGTKDDSYLPIPVNVEGASSDTEVISVSAGDSHTCAIFIINNENKLYCWGYNNNGQLGNDTYYESTTPTHVNTDQLNGTFIKSVYAGYEHTCAINSDDKLYCWGSNNYAQLGDGTTNTTHTTVLVNNNGKLGGSDVISVSLGYEHTCAINNENKLYCWGDSLFWPMPSDNIKTPIPIFDVSHESRTGTILGKNIKEVSVDFKYSCAINDNNKLYCWGNNEYGQLGDGSTEIRTQPNIVNNELIDNYLVKYVSSSYQHTCAIYEINNEDKLYCWGDNSDGQLGNASTNRSLKPVPVSTDELGDYPNVSSVSIGDFHTCAIYKINNMDKLYCWGDNEYGQLGNNSTDDSTKPIPVYTDEIGDNSIVKNVSSGSQHTCAIFNVDNKDKLYCWGDNSYGQLGNNLIYGSSIPVPVNIDDLGNNPVVKSVSLGFEHTCAIFNVENRDKLYCWGDNTYGQLGGYLNIDSTLVEVDIDELGNNPVVKSVTLGTYHTCAIFNADNKDKIFCWGANTYGQLGGGTESYSFTPIPVNTAGLGDDIVAKSVSAGEDHTCAIYELNNEEILYCWGNNEVGQCTKNSLVTSINSKLPVLINYSPCIANSFNYEIGESCYAGLGVCSRTGIWNCTYPDLLESECIGQFNNPNPNGEICSNSLDDNCDGNINENCIVTDCSNDINYSLISSPCTTGVGACLANGIYYCDTSDYIVKCDAVENTSSDEICNDIDDDCDGTTDEGFDKGSTCTVGVGACERTGIKVCSNDHFSTVCNGTPGTPTEEICDGIDNNCDGRIDEFDDCRCSILFSSIGQECSVGLGSCSDSGTYICNTITGEVECDAVAGEPSEEVCNGLDDNCDGTTDEGFDKGSTCTVGVGACESVGIKVCSDDHLSTVCDGTPETPTDEICDGIDNDCDGQIDEGFDKGSTCTVGVGACERSGIRICSEDHLSSFCNVVPGNPDEEVCDGIDNDCDGEIDEGFDIGTKCSVGIGACNNIGEKICSNDLLSTVCNAVPGKPTEEVCDDIDNDCDGIVDNNAVNIVDNQCYRPTDYNKNNHEITDNTKPLQPIINHSGIQGKIAILMEKYTIGSSFKKKQQKKIFKKYGVKNAKFQPYYYVKITPTQKKNKKIINKVVKKNEFFEKKPISGKYKIEYKYVIKAKINKKNIIVWGDQKSNKWSDAAIISIP